MCCTPDGWGYVCGGEAGKHRPETSCCSHPSLLRLNLAARPPHPSAAAAGKTVPPSADVQKLTSLICSDPEAAGDQIRTDVDKGGAGAQVRGACLCGQLSGQAIVSVWRGAATSASIQ